MADWPYSTKRRQRLRAAKLAEKPLCEVHLRREKLVPANTVDHIVSINNGGDPFPDLDGLMSMCTSCHSVKTQARDNPRSFGDGYRPAFKGCDINGRPLDPDHPWLRKQQ